MDKIHWVHGATVAKVGNQGQLQLRKGLMFAPQSEAAKFLEITQNIPSGKETGILCPEDLKWFAIFEFDDVGYVRDDEKDSLDADAMLQSIRKGNDAANEERRRKGWGTMTLVGWVQQPHYDITTHNLEWSLEGKDVEGNLTVNHNTRYLGRRGVMRVNLVASPQDLQTALPRFAEVMQGFSYTPENTYSAFVKGDKVAEYGLTALVVGGAAAVAAKSGLLKYLWKLVVAGILGLGTLFKRLFSSRGIRKPEGSRTEQSAQESR